MPLLTHMVEALKKRGIEARCRLNEDSDTCVTELVIVPPGLPKGARRAAAHDCGRPRPARPVARIYRNLSARRRRGRVGR